MQAMFWDAMAIAKPQHQTWIAWQGKGFALRHTTAISLFARHRGNPF